METEYVKMEVGNVNEASGEKYVMSLDVGTTTIRSMVYNEGGVVMGTAATPVRYHQVRKLTPV